MGLAQATLVVARVTIARVLFIIVKIIFTVVTTEDVAIIEGRGAICQGFRQNSIKKELAGLLVIDFTLSRMERQNLSQKEGICPQRLALFIKLITASVVFLPVAFSFNSPALTSRLSKRPEVFSTDVGFARL